jgi:flagellar biosynthesis GTPase FlhF
MIAELLETQAPALPPASTPTLLELREKACAEAPKFKLQGQQRFLRRVLSPDSPVRNLLMVHGTGVGKTCTAIQVAEE